MAIRLNLTLLETELITGFKIKEFLFIVDFERSVQVL